MRLCQSHCVLYGGRECGKATTHYSGEYKTNWQVGDGIGREYGMGVHKQESFGAQKSWQCPTI